MARYRAFSMKEAFMTEVFEEDYRNHRIGFEGEKQGGMLKIYSAWIDLPSGARTSVPLNQNIPELHLGIEEVKNSKFECIKKLIDAHLEGTVRIPS